MSAHEFMLFLTAGAALLAGWLVVRFPRLTPTSGRGVTTGLFAAFACFTVSPVAVMGVGLALGAFWAVFVVVLPALVCVFLACAWLMLYVMRAIAPYRR